jgi:hypothetical protein
MKATEIIYVELVEEGTACWRPVEAERLGPEIFRVVGEKPDGEVWPFSVGDVVRCKVKTFQSGGMQLVASEKMSA